MSHLGSMDLVAEAKEEIENLSPCAVAAEIGRTDVLLVDLREREEAATIVRGPETEMSSCRENCVVRVLWTGQTLPLPR